MFARLGCLFIVVPLVELALLIQVGRWIGVAPTVALVAVTGLAGVVLVRGEGLRTLARLQLQLARGELPGRTLMDAACILVAGAFLLTPGVLTDLLAFALLVPPTRRLVQGWLLARIGRALKRGTMQIRVGGFGPWGGPGGQGPRSDPGGGRGGEDDDDEDGPRPGPRPGEIVQE